MKQYLELMQRILDEGVEKKDRTGTGTISIFGHQMRFDLSKNFPLVTTKKCHLRSIIHELLWFLNGDTNNKYLEDNSVSIWDEWAQPDDVVNVRATAGKLIDANFRAIDIDGLLVEAKAKYGIDLEACTADDIRGYVKRYCADQEDTDPLWRAGNHWRSVEDYMVYTKRKGDFGPIYGKQWRDWVGPNGEHHDQIANVLRQLREDPDSRRIIVSAWNVADLDKMALPPCHAFMQFYTRELSHDERVQWFADNECGKYAKFEVEIAELSGVDRELAIQHAFEQHSVPTRVLSLQLYQRSCDTFLGLPFNIASYALLTHWIARCVGMAVGEFVWSGGDIHLYSNHLEQAHEQLGRQPRNLPRFVWVSPTIHTDPKDVKPTDFDIIGYDPHPAIKAPIAI